MTIYMGCRSASPALRFLADKIKETDLEVEIEIVVDYGRIDGRRRPGLRPTDMTPPRFP